MPSIFDEPAIGLAGVVHPRPGGDDSTLAVPLYEFV
jgi:hypothetical protein